MTGPRTRPGGGSLVSDPADLARENRELHRLREQVAAVLEQADAAEFIAVRLADRVPEWVGRVRAALGVHQHRFLEDQAHPVTVVSCACGERREITGGGIGEVQR